jgi:hypothetical protein
VSGSSVELGPPGPAEVEIIARGLRSATRPSGLDDTLQVTVLHAVTKSMTGVDVDFSRLEPIDADEFAAAMAARDLAFRTRLVQVMELGHMSLPSADVTVADRVIEYANALGVDNDCIHKARSVADGSHLLVAADFDRNSYIRSLDPSVVVDGCIDATAAWSTSRIDDALAARWRSLGELPPDSIGHRVYEFYMARGFAFPGEAGSAPPLLAQHDWVHVLADFGTTVECELEVFGFIARASDDPQAFALLAMALTLFQTGMLPSAAGIFEADAGHLSATGMPARLGDAMRRGASCEGSVDFLAFDWFAHAERSVEDMRNHFGVQPKSDEAKRAGSVGPWDPLGISEFQKAADRRARPDGR